MLGKRHNGTIRVLGYSQRVGKKLEAADLKVVRR